MARSPKSPPKVHNQATYANHGCRCQVCTTAATSEALRRRRAHRDARLVSQAAGVVHIVEGITHGENGYAYWSCRCEVCRAAHNVACAARARRSRARRRVVEQP
jgi:hypothetical protein